MVTVICKLWNMLIEFAKAYGLYLRAAPQRMNLKEINALIWRKLMHTFPYLEEINALITETSHMSLTTYYLKQRFL